MTSLIVLPPLGFQISSSKQRLHHNSGSSGRRSLYLFKSNERRLQWNKSSFGLKAHVRKKPFLWRRHKDSSLQTQGRTFHFRARFCRMIKTAVWREKKLANLRTPSQLRSTVVAASCICGVLLKEGRLVQLWGKNRWKYCSNIWRPARMLKLEHKWVQMDNLKRSDKLVTRTLEDKKSIWPELLLNSFSSISSVKRNETKFQQLLWETSVGKPKTFDPVQC